MSKRGHYDGPKHRGNHTTIIPASEDFVKAVCEIEDVSGISPGFIDPRARSKKPRIKIKPLPAGLQVEVMGNTAKQIFFIYTDYPSKVQSLIKQKFG